MSMVNELSASPKPRGRGLNMALWVLQGLLAAVFVMAAGAKLAGVEVMVKQFDAIGLGQWFRYLTAILEIVAAVLLLIPRRSGYGAVLLMVIMIGAAGAHVFVFKDSPAPPLVFLALASVVAWGRLVRPRAGVSAV